MALVGERKKKGGGGGLISNPDVIDGVGQKLGCEEVCSFGSVLLLIDTGYCMAGVCINRWYSHLRHLEVVLRAAVRSKGGRGLRERGSRVTQRLF